MSQKILLVQENAWDATSVRQILLDSTGGPFEVEWVRCCSEALERLVTEGKQKKRSELGIAAVLVELFLPDSRGLETFDHLFGAAPQIPILVLSEFNDEAIAREAVHRGAQDYLPKARLDSYTLPKALNNMIERANIAEALFEEKERAQVTLNSIGDAVISTDPWGHVTYLNAVAERMTGWPREEASGQPVEDVLRIIDAVTRQPVTNPMAQAILDNRTIELAQSSILIRRDGVEVPIEDSSAPIHNRVGQTCGAVMVFRDISMVQAMSLRMSYLARHDSLTDLPNRTLLNDRLNQAIALAKRNNKKLALLFMDVDRFKHINDSLGHAVGDSLLQSIARRLRACVRNSDTVSRQGGDEFVILLPDIERAEDVAASAGKILLAVSAPDHIGDDDLNITMSIGIVIYPDDGADAGSLMKNADIAMYHAKDGGRNNYQFFTPEMNRRAIARQLLENDLRHACERREFELHYQPIVSLSSGEIVAAEALLRWNHPQQGRVQPSIFIPVAEECGFILAIGRWVLREGCRQAQAWQIAGLPPLRLTINISAVQLRIEDFLATVRAVLTETGLAPRHLELELTETFLMQDSESTASILDALNDMGVQLALDDFGTGYSSLSYLKRFSIDTMKIDRSFVRDLTTDPDDAGIVSAVINMGKSLHMRVIAEGVETGQQLAFLHQHGCPEGQGHYFSAALPAAEFTLLLERGLAKPHPFATSMMQMPEAAQQVFSVETP